MATPHPTSQIIHPNPLPSLPLLLLLALPPSLPLPSHLMSISMGESAIPSSSSPIYLPPPSSPPSHAPPPSALPLPPPETPKRAGFPFSNFQRPTLRVTSEFDSDSSLFFNKVSCKLFDSLAKLKLSFHNNRNGEVSSPQLGFITKNLSVLYDFESQNALVKGSLDVGNRLQFRATRDIKEEQGEVSMIACLGDPSYKLELSSSLPVIGLPRAAIRFPLGEISVEKRDAEVAGALSINGILKSQVMNGVLTAFGGDDEMRLRYSYKDEEMTFIPSISLPSKALSFAFKRRFTPLSKMSYWYHFNSNDWSAVYKHTVGKDLKLKAGYDSEVRLGWASLWVGDESGKAKTAPIKMKVQFMVQVPQDDIVNSLFLFRVKKRWDI